MAYDKLRSAGYDYRDQSEGFNTRGLGNDNKAIMSSLTRCERMLSTLLYKMEQQEKRLSRMETRLCITMEKLGVDFEGKERQW